VWAARAGDLGRLWDSIKVSRMGVQVRPAVQDTWVCRRHLLPSSLAHLEGLRLRKSTFGKGQLP
jgi:hypothetical protein